MERSFRLMAEAGNDVVGISGVGRNVFGDDAAIVFRRKADLRVSVSPW